MNNIIRKTRTDNGLTQVQMSEKLNISRTSLVGYEKLEDKNIPVKIINKLVELFEIEIKTDNYTYNIIKSEENINQEEFRINVPQKNIEKFKEVLLYILEKIGAKPNVGQTVLYKILYFIDFDYYELYEEQLMGAKYIKNHYGPTPVDFAKIIKSMESSGDLETVKSKYYNKTQTKYLPIRKSNSKLLNGQEIEHINKIIEKHSDKTALDLSDFSHKDVPWIISEDGEPIDYESVFYRTPETSVRSYEK